MKRGVSLRDRFKFGLALQVRPLPEDLSARLYELAALMRFAAMGIGLVQTTSEGIARSRSKFPLASCHLDQPARRTRKYWSSHEGGAA